MSFHYHPYHIVHPSPWPLLASIGTLAITTGVVSYTRTSHTSLLCTGILITALVAIIWWRDIIRESTLIGDHTLKVQSNMRWGIVLFITSEIMFFFSFFWAWFNMSLSSNLEVGFHWPPIAIIPFNPFTIPLFNTVILLSSGLTVTWAHHRILAANHTDAIIRLLLTIMLGIVFTLTQGYEYYIAPFTFSDSSYGSCFFMATGFHGIHVIIGTVFLSTMLYRLSSGDFSVSHHFGFEASAWYWHFVDVVWLFLYISLYWWGS